MISDFLDQTLLLIVQPSSRIYFINLLGSLAVVLAWGFFTPTPTGQFIQKMLLNKKYWWNRSTKYDYQLFLANGLLKTWYLPLLMATGFYLSTISIQLLQYFFAPIEPFSSNHFNWTIAALIIFIWDDFLRFGMHYSMHKVPYLWRLHKTHHSAKILTPMTLYRIHPLESFLASCRNVFCSSVASAGLLFFLQPNLELEVFAGANLFVFALGLFTGNLRHSHLKLSFGLLEYLFISPLQHQIHHSSKKEYYDKNFGVWLSIWDQVFGSMERHKT